MTKTLLLGLDGVTFDMLDSYMDAGDMPNLKHLIREGCSGPLESTMPPVTGSAWLSLATGQNPGTTGIYDFIYRTSDDEFDFKYMDSSKYRGRAIWDCFEENESVGVVDYPTLSPPYAINGFMTSGGLGAAERSSVPKSIDEDLSQYPRPEPHLDLRDDRYQDLTLFMEDLSQNLERRKQIVLHCIENYDWNLLWAVVQEPDWLQHMMWHVFDESHERSSEATDELRELLRTFWEDIDDLVGECEAALPDETNMVIMSDHGFGPLHNRIFRLNTWLKNEGYFTPKTLGSSQYWVKKRIRNFMSTAANWLNLQRHAPDLFQWGKDKTSSFAIQLNAVDLEQTLLFDPGHIGSMGGLYLTDHARESERSTEDLIGKVRSKLERFGEEQGLQINTYTPAELYGHRASGSPDLIVRVDGGLIEDGGWNDQIFDELPERLSHQTGSHRREGILIASGPDFTTEEVEDAALWDLAPTILHAHDYAIPSWMDGRVLTDTLTTDRPIRESDSSSTGDKGQELSEEEREEMQKQLSNLGYFD